MMRDRKKIAVLLSVLAVCAFLLQFLWTRGIYGNLSEDLCASDLFRQMKVTPAVYRTAMEFAAENSCDPMDVLTVIMILERLEPAENVRWIQTPGNGLRRFWRKSAEERSLW